MNNLKTRAFQGMVWTFAQQFSLQMINLIVQIILARLLIPEMFGLIAMVTVFTAIGYTLMDGGMTSSVIRTKNPNQLDYSIVFLTNIVVSILVYILVYFLASWVADFYDKEILKDILRVLSLSFVIRALSAVHIAKLTKELNFKMQMKLEIPASILAGGGGVLMAYLGYGVWSLVALTLINAIVITILCWRFVKWKPSFVFDKNSFKYHFNFGYKMTLSSLLDTVYRNIYNIAIGKAFLPTTVGYFNQAENMRTFPINQISSVMNKVTYPLFAEINNDTQLKGVYKRIMKMVFFIVVPIMMILIVSGQELFLIVFGEKWLPAVPYFQILGFASIVTPVSIYNLNILKVKGRSDMFLRLETIKKFIGFSAVFIVIPFGIFPLVISYMMISYVFTVINMVYSGRLINYGFWEQCKDCSSIFILGFGTLILSYYFRETIRLYESNPLSSFLLVSLFFLIIYLPAIYLREKNIFRFMISLIKT